jgi:hypothetical protein
VRVCACVCCVCEVSAFVVPGSTQESISGLNQDSTKGYQIIITGSTRIRHVVGEHSLATTVFLCSGTLHIPDLLDLWAQTNLLQF